MSDGDCELMAQMKDLIASNFTLRALSYRTDCVPQEINGFSIKAQVLKALAAAGHGGRPELALVGAVLPVGAAAPPVVQRRAESRGHVEQRNQRQRRRPRDRLRR